MARILIAEDDLTSQKLAAAFVKSMGHEYLVSPNGRHALETLRAANHIDLVLTDIMMPEMGGRELIEVLRADARLAKIPVIIMSAVVGVRDISDLLRAGAEFFLAKPIDRSELQDYVERCLGAVPSRGRSA